MISVKKQGPFEVFSRGVEEPWSIWRGGVPLREVWTWNEVEAILGGETKSPAKPVAKKKKQPQERRHHATRKTESPATGRWIHRDVARRHDVPEDVVRRIYAAVQIAKRQDLYGGYMADLVERSVGRKLVGQEYTVYSRAKEHLGYDPPGGYGGPKPRGSAKEPPRVKYDDPKVQTASGIVSSADRTIKAVLGRVAHSGWNEAKDRELLRQAADELDVAADLNEEAGARVRAGTLRERARHARSGYYKLLASYD